jgi:hypothetical protein
MCFFYRSYCLNCEKIGTRKYVEQRECGCENKNKRKCRKEFLELEDKDKLEYAYYEYCIKCCIKLKRNIEFNIFPCYYSWNY